MAFKMKGSPAKMGMISGTSGHRSALKQIAQGGTRTWREGTKFGEKYGKDLDQLTRDAKKYTKGSKEYDAIQNQINIILGSKKRHGVTTTTKGKVETYTTPGIATTTTKTKKRKEIKKTDFEFSRGDGRSIKTVTKYDKKGDVKTSVTKRKCYTSGSTGGEIDSKFVV